MTVIYTDYGLATMEQRRHELRLERIAEKNKIDFANNKLRSINTEYEGITRTMRRLTENVED